MDSFFVKGVAMGIPISRRFPSYQKAQKIYYDLSRMEIYRLMKYARDAELVSREAQYVIELYTDGFPVHIKHNPHGVIMSIAVLVPRELGIEKDVLTLALEIGLERGVPYASTEKRERSKRGGFPHQLNKKKSNRCGFVKERLPFATLTEEEITVLIPHLQDVLERYVREGTKHWKKNVWFIKGSRIPLGKFVRVSTRDKFVLEMLASDDVYDHGTLKRCAHVIETRAGNYKYSPEGYSYEQIGKFLRSRLGAAVNAWEQAEKLFNAKRKPHYLEYLAGMLSKQARGMLEKGLSYPLWLKAQRALSRGRDVIFEDVKLSHRKPPAKKALKNVFAREIRENGVVHGRGTATYELYTKANDHLGPTHAYFKREGESVENIVF